MVVESKLNRSDLVLKRLIKLKKINKTSNASQKIFRLNSLYPIQYKFKKLLLRKGWLAGRTSTGSISVFSKGPIKKNKIPFINYSFRQKSLYFIGGINYTNNFKNKLYTIIFNSNGEVSYIPSRSNDILFFLSKLDSIGKTYNTLFRDVLVFKPFIQIVFTPFLLIQQEKNSNISFLESKPLHGVSYTRSIGSKSKILKLDTRTGYALVTMSSGLKKVFSIFSLSTEGCANLNLPKKTLCSTKSSDFTKKGFKPTVRGVAMNPVDHPHGGRTKSIKYHRTP